MAIRRVVRYWGRLLREVLEYVRDNRRVDVVLGDVVKRLNLLSDG